ncbi:MAG: hypothetical protein ACQR30_12480 [Arachidicoccus sp.]
MILLLTINIPLSIVDIKLNMDSRNLYNGNRDSIADLNVDYRLQSE